MTSRSARFGGDGLLASISDAVGRLTIDKPARRNALTAKMWDDLPGAVDWLVGEKARVVLVEGAGETFSAGADISEFDQVRGDTESARAYDRLNADAFQALRVAAVPTIAVIRGICYGGGLGLAAACDLRIAEPGARFAVPAARLGLTYPVDAISDLVETLGVQTVKHLIFTAGSLDAETALQLGFLLAVHETGRLGAEADDLARRIASNAPLTIRASKRAVRAAISRNAADRAEAGRIGEETFASADYAEGRAAFREKRQPRFTGG